MKKYPLKLEPYKKGVVWGGTKLRDEYSKAYMADDLGETWELSVREKENSVIVNGEYSGKTLGEYLGSPDEFPLLVKLIDANDALSIQVHPHKHEMWYVVEAEENAKIVYGVGEAFDLKKVSEAVSEGTLEKMLNYVPVKAGDAFFIPDGLVHSICGGVLIAEIQENDDTTYRLYDYNRPQSDGSLRQLHIEASLSTVVDWRKEDIEARRYSMGKKSEDNLANCRYFSVDKFNISGKKCFINEDYTHILCVEGEGEVSGEPLKKGDSYFIPQGMEKFILSSDGDITVIISSVPKNK